MAIRFGRMLLNSKFRGKTMSKTPQEWFKQAAYDIKSAEVMFNNKRHIYAVFLCHLSIEKALKGLYLQELDKMPPKSHNLVFLLEKIKKELPVDLYDFIFTLNGVSIPTAIRKIYRN